MNRLKSNHQDLKLNTIIYWQPMKVVKYRFNMIEFHCVRHSLKPHFFADLMNVTEEVTIHRLNVSTLLSSAFIRGDLNAATRGPFI